MIGKETEHHVDNSPWAIAKRELSEFYSDEEIDDMALCEIYEIMSYDE